VVFRGLSCRYLKAAASLDAIRSGIIPFNLIGSRMSTSKTVDACIAKKDRRVRSDIVGKNFVNVKQIQAFRAVMVTGTTLEAGQLLHVSQPAVSRLIAGLEAVAGYQLFERKQGRLRPTRQAEILLTEVEKAFAGLDRIASLLNTGDSGDIPHLCIMATAPMAHGLLPSALEVFRRRFPDVSVSVRVVVRRELRAQLDSQEFDIALSTYPLDYPEHASESLATAEAVCVLPVGHRLASRKLIQPTDLLDEHFISMPLETGARQKIDVLFQQTGEIGR